MFTILTGIVLRLVKSLLRDPIRTTLQLIVHRAVSHSVLPFNTPHRYFSCQFKLGIYSSIAFFKFLQSDDEFSTDGHPMVSPGNVIAQSMLDRSRIALCMCMLTVFTLNPFGALFSQADSSDTSYNKAGHRTILGTGVISKKYLNIHH